MGQLETQMQEFRFEYKHKLSETEYNSVWSVISPKPFNRILRRVVLVFVTVLCFFWAYTFLLGVLGVVIIFLMLFMPQVLPGTVRRQYRKYKITGKTLTYGVDNKSLWIKGKDISAKISWSFLTVWRIRGDWLVLQSDGIPPFYLPISQLESQGVFAEVMGLVEKYGKKFRES